MNWLAEVGPVAGGEVGDADFRDVKRVAHSINEQIKWTD